MMVSVAARAPTSPPDTGASTYSQPRPFTRAASSFVTSGEMELVSTKTFPGESPAATPSGPKRTFSTSAVSGTMQKVTSATRATSRPLPQATPPASTSSRGTPLRDDR